MQSQFPWHTAYKLFALILYHKPVAMKRSLKLLLLLFILLPLILMQSCRKDEPDPYADNKYLVSSKVELMRTKDNIVTLINLASFLYPELAGVANDVVSGVNVYSIEYNTSFLGKDIVASGLVMIPSVPGDYPVLSFQNGTNTLNAYAPSVDPDSQANQLLLGIASTGYVVIIADYLGFGATKSMAHPYLHKESTVQTLIDMLRSVAEFDKDVAKEISISNECYLMGYSQGGWATLALLEAIESNYASEFNVKATCCGAGPYDLNYFNDHVLSLTEYPMPVFLGYIVNAYSKYTLYANPLTDLINAPYAARIPGLYDGMHTSEAINSKLTVSIAGLFKAEYIAGYASAPVYQGVRTALSGNSIEGWDSNVPILFLHGTADKYVFPALSARMHDDMLDAGSSPLNCLYVTMEGLDHSQAAVPALFAGLEFFKLNR